MTGGGARRDFWCWPGLVSRFVSWSQGGLRCDHAVYLMSVPFLVLMLHCNKSNSHNHKQHPPGPAPVHGMVDQICSLTSEGTDCKRTLPGYEGGALHFISEVSPAGPRGILGGENREGLPTTSLPHAQLQRAGVAPDARELGAPLPQHSLPGLGLLLLDWEGGISSGRC